MRWICLLVLAVVGARDARAQEIQATATPHVSVTSARPGETVRLAIQVTVPEGFHVQSDRPRDPALIPTTIWIDTSTGVRVREIVFPPSTDFIQEGSPEPLAVFERDFFIGVEVVLPSNAAGTVTIPARVRYQACDDKVCFRPRTLTSSWTVRIDPAGGSPVRPEIFTNIAFGSGRPYDATAAPPPLTPDRAAAIPAASGAAAGLARLDAFTITGSTGGYLNTDEFLRFVADAEAGVQRRGLFDDRGPLAILALVFVGGLALNLTPCVLPMIPINLAIIGAGAQAGNRRRGFLLGATYGGAMAVAYGLLGLVVILTAGTFGAINASPWFNLGIAVLFVLLALAMFDVITVDFSRWSSRIRFSEGSRGTYLLAFGMGTVAALLAGACVAPVVIQVVLFASDLYAKGNALALALPFFLGIGMALPWPIAGAGLSALPKPGPWMVRVKYVFGLFILGTALYYGALAYGLFANRWVDPGDVRASVEAQLKSGWHASLDEGLAIAARDNTPVLVDLWATWCKNCLTMDKTTLADGRVIAALSGYTKIKVQAEDPDDPATAAIMRRFDAVGLPAYVILKPRQP